MPNAAGKDQFLAAAWRQLLGVAGTVYSTAKKPTGAELLQYA
jgi:hypothetical protein